MNVIAELTSTLGKFYIVAGLVPALLFTLAHWLLASSTLGERLPSWARSLPQLGERVFPLGEQLSKETSVVPVSLLLGVLIPIILGALLMMLNHVLIQLFEGRPGWLRHGLFWPFLQRNRRAWKAERDEFTAAGGDQARQVYEAWALNYKLMEGEDKSRALRKLQGAKKKLVDIEDRLEAHRRWPRFPAKEEMVLPTAMGNAWAVIEEYPFRRYGMDGVLYWPRLVPLLESESEETPFAPGLASRIANQKTVFDALFHSALLAGFLGLEMVILSLFDLSQASLIFAFNLGSLIGGLGVLFVAYGLYRAAVNSIYILGDLIATAYDLLRPALASAMGLTLPDTPEAEYQMWEQVGLFLHRGRPYYHPASLSNQDMQPTTSDEPGDEPELEEAYRVFKVKEPSAE
jgi:hypothetical protein